MLIIIKVPSLTMFLYGQVLYLQTRDRPFEFKRVRETVNSLYVSRTCIIQNWNLKNISYFVVTAYPEKIFIFKRSDIAHIDVH